MSSFGSSGIKSGRIIPIGKSTSPRTSPLLIFWDVREFIHPRWKSCKTGQKVKTTFRKSKGHREFYPPITAHGIIVACWKHPKLPHRVWIERYKFRDVISRWIRGERVPRFVYMQKSNWPGDGYSASKRDWAFSSAGISKQAIEFQLMRKSGKFKQFMLDIHKKKPHKRFRDIPFRYQPWLKRKK